MVMYTSIVLISPNVIHNKQNSPCKVLGCEIKHFPHESNTIQQFKKLESKQQSTINQLSVSVFTLRIKRLASCNKLGRSKYKRKKHKIINLYSMYINIPLDGAFRGGVS